MERDVVFVDKECKTVTRVNLEGFFIFFALVGLTIFSCSLMNIDSTSDALEPAS